MRLEDLLSKPGPELQAALAKVPDALFAAALHGADPAVRNGFLQNLSARRRETVVQAEQPLADLSAKGVDRARTLVIKLVLEALGGKVPEGAPTAQAVSAPAGPKGPPSKKALEGFLKRLALKNKAVAEMQDNRRAQILLEAFFRGAGKKPPGTSESGPKEKSGK